MEGKDSHFLFKAALSAFYEKNSAQSSYLNTQVSGMQSIRKLEYGVKELLVCTQHIKRMHKLKSSSKINLEKAWPKLSTFMAL